MFTKLFKKNQDNSDVFKKLIHRLSDMSVQDLEKIDRLLDIIFTPDQGSEQLKTEATYREETLDDTLKEAKNQLHKEQLEKNLERFRKTINNAPTILFYFLFLRTGFPTIENTASEYQELSFEN